MKQLRVNVVAVALCPPPPSPECQKQPPSPPPSLPHHRGVIRCVPCQQSLQANGEPPSA